MSRKVLINQIVGRKLRSATLRTEPEPTKWPADEVAQRGQANEVARRGQAPYEQDEACNLRPVMSPMDAELVGT